MEEDRNEEITKEVKDNIEEVAGDNKEVENDSEELENTQVIRKQEPPKKKKTGVKIVVIILILILLIILCYAAYLNFLPKHSKSIEAESDDYRSEYRLSGNGLEAFDLYFLQLENESKNKVYSPLSIKYALEMLAEGADGDSKTQLDAIIGDYKAKNYANSNHMSFANAMFVRDSFKDVIREEYTEHLKNKYNAEMIVDPFQNASNINNWVNEKTFKLIPTLLSDENVQDANFYIINALAIDMNWVNRIQSASAPLPEGMGDMNYNVKYPHENYFDYITPIEDDNYPRMEFDGKNNIKSVKVGASFNRYNIVKDKGEDKIRKEVGDAYDKAGQPCGDKESYVNSYIEALKGNYNKSDISTDFYISDKEDIKIFAKDLQKYDGVTLQYVGIMPKDKSLAEFVQDIDVKKLQKEINEMKEVKLENFKDGVVTQIKGNIPLFNYDYELKLKDDLEKLGVSDIFDINKANLSQMLKDGKKQYIFDAVHKANIEFSNDGIKAAAATAMGGTGSASCDIEFSYDVPVETIDITFNKPYMYIIRDKDSGEVWFAGTVYEPTK